MRLCECPSVAAIPHHKIKIGFSNFGCTLRRIMGCAKLNIIKTGKRQRNRAKVFLRHGIVCDLSATAVAVVIILSYSRLNST